MKTIHLILFQFCILLIACDKSDKLTPPDARVDSIYLVTHQSALIGFTIEFNDYSSSNSSYGLCLGETPNPSLDKGIGSNNLKYNEPQFTAYIGNLAPNQTYYARAYVKLPFSDEVVYSKEQTFTTKSIGTFTDARDGQQYGYLKIGNLVWMAGNLNFNVANQSWLYQNNDGYKEYGRLYNLEGALKAVPEGWRLPTDQDWIDLEKAIGLPDSVLNRYLERGSDQAQKIKEPDQSHWSMGRGTNETGFSALPAGMFIPASVAPDSKDRFEGLGSSATFLSSTTNDQHQVVIRQLIDFDDVIIRNTLSDKIGVSVRCVKD